jgi:aminoglycoside/choline kinase family phosphotransferase
MTGRPLLAAPAFDGMNLGPALVEVFGQVPERAVLHKLRGDASTRSYYRVDLPEHERRSVVVMRLPADALKSDEGDSSARPSELPFMNVQRMLRARSIRVPEVLADHTTRGVLVLEDLGDETFFERLDATSVDRWDELYTRAIDVLVEMHTRCAEQVQDCVAYQRSFDRRLLRWELEHFREWGLEALDMALSDTERRALDQAFDRLVEHILALPQGFVHRDYQSRNLMWVGDELVVIDFQDALQGPRVYDLVSLLCDSYVQLDEAFQTRMIEHYAARSGVDRTTLAHEFWLVAAQRKLKDSGRFVYIDQVRGNPDFLQWFSQSLRYVARALRHLPSDCWQIEQLLTNRLAGFPDAVPTPPARTGIHASRAV